MEVYFNMFKVKYEILHELLRNDNTVNIKTNDRVNIFINLEPILIKLSNPRIIEQMKVNTKNSQLCFISSIINLAAHYKWFFTKFNVNANIYMYFPSLSVNEYKNQIFNKDYRKYYTYKFKENVQNESLYKIISSSIPFIQVILEYIKDVYIIDSNSIENSVVPYVITKDKDDENINNFIISTSLYDFQYVNYDFKIIVPKKEESFIVNKGNVISYIADINNCDGTYNFSYKFLPFILSLVGSKNRNIYNIKGVQFKSAYKTVQTVIDNRIITDGVTNIHMLIEIIKPVWRDHIINNYYCTDIQSQYNQLNKKDIHDIISQIKDRYDNGSLKKINDKYFGNYPLMLMEITASVKKY